MPYLPKPITFADGQRAFFGACMAAAGIFAGFGFSGIILILWRGGWAVATEPQRITAISLMGSGFPIAMVMVIVALAIGGPVGRYKVRADRDGVEVEADRNASDGQQDFAPPPCDPPSDDGAEGPHVP